MSPLVLEDGEEQRMDVGGGVRRRLSAGMAPCQAAAAETVVVDTETGEPGPSPAPTPAPATALPPSPQVYHGPEELRVTTRHGDGGSPVSASLQEMYGLVNRAKEANSKRNGCRDFWAAQWAHLTAWLLDVEMGVVWSVASLSIISFIFASIWYIDPALLTMVLQFQAADCTTVKSAYLIGISNCSWSSCRHGCTAEVYKCWQVEVNFSLVAASQPIPPPWGSLTSLAMPRPAPSHAPAPASSHAAKLYPNVRGCGYPPQLQCSEFFDEYGEVGGKFPCWVSHLDPDIAITELDLRRLKREVMYSLVPLAIFILFTLYAFCRLGVFSICNPFRCCPTPADQADTATLTPKQLFRYKKTLMAKKAAALQSFQKCDVSSLAIPATIVEADQDEDARQQELGLGSEAGEARGQLVLLESETARGGQQLREPSDRIEVAASPVR